MNKGTRLILSSRGIASRRTLSVALVVLILLIPCSSPAQISRYTTGTMSTGRFFHTATLLSDGRVLLVHGLANSRLPNLECELFDPVTELFTDQLCVESIRAQHNAAELPDGRVLVVGLDQFLSLPGEIIDVQGSGAANEYYTAGTIQPRVDATMTQLLDGRLLVVGGMSAYSGGIAVTEAEIYDPSSNSWSQAGTTGSWLAHDAVRLVDGRVLITGGIWQLRSAVLYDPRDSTFTPTSDMLVGREDHRMTVLPDGTVLVSGGSEGDSRDTAEIFDPETETFIFAVNTMSSPREDHLSVLLPDGSVLVAGGENNTASGDIVLDSADLYHPATGAFEPLPALLSPRDDATATLLVDGSVFIAGGEDSAGVGLRTAEVWSLCAGSEPTANPVGNTLRLKRSGDRILLEWDSPVAASSYLVHRGLLPTSLGSNPWQVATDTTSWMAREDGVNAYVRIRSVNSCGVPTDFP